MGLLDRFKAQAAKPPTAPKGTSGRGNTAGYVVPDELNSKLALHAGYRVWERMWRTDSDVASRLLMLLNPIAGATYSVEPFGGEEADERAIQHAKFVEWCLMERMTPSFPSHLYAAMKICGRMGNAPHEQVYASDTWEGKTVLALDTLGVILPRTVWGHQTENRRLKGITQSANGDGTEIVYDARDLVYYRFGAEGDNWEGTSLLRTAYKPWKYKEALELIDSIAHERFRVGTPIVYPPVGAADGDMEDAQTALENLRSNAQAFIVAPGPKAGAGAAEGQGWLFEILTPPGGGSEGSSVQASISAHRDAISAAMLVEFMRLGQSGTGARATADVQQDPFHMYCQALAETTVVDAINDQLIPRLVLVNFDDAEGLPKLKASIAGGPDIVAIGTLAKTLYDAGVLHPDDDLEDYFRRETHMPAADPKAREERKAQEAEQKQAEVDAAKLGAQPQPGAGGKETTVVKSASGGGVPGAKEKVVTTEKHLSMGDPDEKDAAEQRIVRSDIKDTLDRARDEMETATEPVLAASITRLLEAARAGEDRPEPDEALVSACERSLSAVYAAGTRTAQAELDGAA